MICKVDGYLWMESLLEIKEVGETMFYGAGTVEIQLHLYLLQICRMAKKELKDSPMLGFENQPGRKLLCQR